MRVELLNEGIRISEQPETLTSLDVSFSGQRVWSFAVDPDVSTTWFPWPQMLDERLTGWASVEVRDSATEKLFCSEHLEFDDSGEPFMLEDASGRPLMLNKWLRLAPMLADGEGVDKRDELALILATARDTLQDLGYRVFAVGGTLLGPFRDGDFLPHDDDGDLAVFFDLEEPADVALGMLRLRRELLALGYRVRVHSHAHLQIYIPIPGVDSKLYVDVFAAFFTDGMINQPFHVRGAFRREDLIPFSTIHVRGESFPAPANIEAWLELNYDENWMMPQPGFQLATPESTVRRFKSWFGSSYNFHRHFWELQAAEGRCVGDYQRLDPSPPPLEFTSSSILNVGSGPAPLLPSTVISTSPEAVVYALDYADSVRELAIDALGVGGIARVEVRDVNFVNYSELLDLVSALPPGPFDVYAGFAIEGQDRERRQPVFWRLARMSLASGGQVLIDHLDTLSQNYSYRDPRTWHMDVAKLQTECAAHGLLGEVLGEGVVEVAGEERSYTRSRIVLEGVEDRHRLLGDALHKAGEE